jgi:predicted cupin superfamily sugar epimerase
MTATELIEHHQLQPHPEGGWYREIYRAAQTVASPVNGENRSAFTHIYFLLERGQVSRFHKVLHSEIWNFYAGAALRLITFGADPGKITTTQLGGEISTATYVSIIEPDHYQAAESTGDFSLVGCSVAPGFDFADFSFLKDNDTKLAARLTERGELSKFV